MNLADRCDRSDALIRLNRPYLLPSRFGEPERVSVRAQDDDHRSERVLAVGHKDFRARRHVKSRVACIRDDSYDLRGCSTRHHRLCGSGRRRPRHSPNIVVARLSVMIATRFESVPSKRLKLRPSTIGVPMASK